jgi:putative transposase
MARPLRYELPGALYHLTSRSRDTSLYQGEQDRQGWIEILKGVMSRYHWRCLAWCQLEQHYHLVVSPEDGRLSLGMHQLNASYTRLFNQRHGRKGRLFGGRFQAVLVDEQRYLLPLVHEVLTEPRRMGLVEQPLDWRWSSAAALAGRGPPIVPLDMELLQQLSGAESSSRDFWPQYLSREQQQRLWDKVRHQQFLGDRHFVKKIRQQTMQSAVKSPLLLADFRDGWDRSEAMARAYLDGGYTLQQIADHFFVHPSTVSRKVAAYEKSLKKR